MIENILEVAKHNRKIMDLLSSCPLFILEHMQVCNFSVGKFKLMQEKKYDFTYIIISGQVKIFLLSTSGKSVILDIYESGMLIGEQEAIIDKPYSASVLNITDVTLLKMSNLDFKRWVACDNSFANKLIYNLSSQIYNLTQKTERYSLYSAMEQIIALLLQSNNKKTITREVLTYEVDTSYRNINRILKKLIDLKAINLVDGKINILDRKLIEQLFWKNN